MVKPFLRNVGLYGGAPRHLPLHVAGPHPWDAPGDQMPQPDRKKVWTSQFPIKGSLLDCSQGGG